MLLGPPRIDRAGAAIATDTRKAIALLAYLAMTGRPQARESLAALLWPDAEDARARGALRRTLSTLRTSLGGEELRTDGSRVALDDRAVEVDALRFRALVAEGRFAEAVTLYSGDFLAGFSLKDSREFDEWQAEEADALRRELAGALERLVIDTADPKAALAYARRWASIDPLDEPAHAAVMRLHAQAGDRSAALHQYRELVRTLDRELGVSPLAETVALARAIESGQGELARSRKREGSAGESVGDLHTRHGDYPKAIASYETALASTSGLARARIEHKLADVHHRRGDWDRAESHYRAALAGQDDPGHRARVSADWSLAVHRRGDVSRAKRLAEDALGLAKRARDEWALAQALNITGILTGDRTRLEESLAIAARIGDEATRVAALNNLAIALGRAGDTERATDLTREALGVAASLGDRHREAALHNNLADLLHQGGKRDEAERELRRAARLFSEIGGDSSAMEPEVWKLVQW
jgi:DNA-binding SARP family transcriptional activator